MQQNGKDQKSVEERVVDVVNGLMSSMKEGFDRKQITPDADFIRDLGADSLDCIELRMKLEEAFGIEISDDDYGAIKTPKQAAEYIKGKLVAA